MWCRFQQFRRDSVAYGAGAFDEGALGHGLVHFLVMSGAQLRDRLVFSTITFASLHPNPTNILSDVFFDVGVASLLALVSGQRPLRFSRPSVLGTALCV